MVRKVPLLPNIITAFGLSCGLFVIFRTTMTEPGESHYDRLVISVVLLMLAAFADLLDGFVARTLKVESDFGSVFDTLADSISFGVAPAVMILKTLSVAPGSELSYLLSAAAMIYAVCGVLRLVRYSVTSALEKGDIEAMEASKKHFTGLPIPAACAAAVSANLILVSPDVRRWFTISEEIQASILSVVLLLLGYLMISRWKFFSLKTLNIRVASFQIVVPTAVSAVFLFYGLLQHFAVTFFIVAWAYVIVALILSLTRYVMGKRVQQLEDFEPDAEDEI